MDLADFPQIESHHYKKYIDFQNQCSIPAGTKGQRPTNRGQLFLGARLNLITGREPFKRRALRGGAQVKPRPGNDGAAPKPHCFCAVSARFRGLDFWFFFPQRNSLGAGATAPQNPQDTWPRVIGKIPNFSRKGVIKATFRAGKGGVVTVLVQCCRRGRSNSEAWTRSRYCGCAGAGIRTRAEPNSEP